MHRLTLALLSAVLLAPSVAAGQTLTYAVVPPECAFQVTQPEAEGYYQAIVRRLTAVKGLKVLERRNLPTVLKERDLASTFGPDRADAVHGTTGHKMQAARILIPGVCRLQNDYVLSLRCISTRNGATLACSLRQTRLPSKFADVAAGQVEEILASLEESVVAAQVPPEATVRVSEVRAACQKVNAEQLFPALWQRAEAIREKAPEAAALDPASYYVALLHLCSRAMSPPRGMVFIPGGRVEIETTAGAGQLWVEPFFIDRCEVSVGQYMKSLHSLQASAEGQGWPQDFVPFTIRQATLGDPESPVTGISWQAADAYARRCRKQLPTVLQWMRAAGGDDGRLYPCGSAAEAARCNLRGPQDGFASVAPAEHPGDDESPFGVMGMTGNVREWTATWYCRDAYARGSADAPKEPASGTMRVVKGGSWRTAAAEAECRQQDECKPGEAFDDVGLRCVVPFFHDLIVDEKEEAASGETERCYGYSRPIGSEEVLP